MSVIEHVYEYVGTVFECYVRPSKGTYPQENTLILGDLRNREKAPVMLLPVGEMQDYIAELEGGDDEERYFNSTWGYNANLGILYIEVPSRDPKIPAKAIGCNLNPYESWESYGKLTIFGPHDHITEPEPEPMYPEEYAAWKNWKLSHVRNIHSCFDL